MATPTLVQYSTFASQQGNNSTLKKCPLPNAVLSGNIVIVLLTCSDGVTPTVSDDQSNTYSTLINADDSTHGQRAMIAYCANVTNGPKEVRISNATGFSYCSATVMEFYNVATSTPTDGSNSATGTTNNPKPASFTTTVDGDLIVYAAVRDDASSPIVSVTAPTGTLVSADIEDAWIAQYQIQATAGSIQPAATWDSAAYSWVAVAGAFKAATAGTAPTASPRVVGIHHQAVNRGGTGSSWTGQVPTSLCNGNSPMLYAAFIGVAADALTSITDSVGNLWVATGPTNVQGGSGNVRGYYVKSPTISATATITLTYGGPGAGPGDTLMLYECVGMDQSRPFDSQTTATGNQLSGTSFSSSAITPRLDTGIVFFTVGVTSHTVTGITSPSGAVFVSSTDPNEEFSPWPNDENNAWAFKVNTDKSTLTPTWTNDLNVDNWAGITDAFKSNAALAPYPRPLMLPWAKGASKGSRGGVILGLMLNPRRPKGVAQTATVVDTPVNPGVGNLTITGYAPTVVQNTNVAPGVGTLTITGYAPTVVQNTAVAPGVGSLTITGYAPTVVQGTQVAPGVGNVTITGYAPTILQDSRVNPGAGTITITGYAPTVTQQVNTPVNPDVGVVTITGYAPTVAQTLNQFANPGAGTLTITGYAPSVVQDNAVAPAVGTLTITGYAPTVTQQSGTVVNPDVGILTLTGYAPTVAQTANQSVNPGAGALVIQGYAPIITQTVDTSGTADAAKAPRKRRIPRFYADEPQEQTPEPVVTVTTPEPPPAPVEVESDSTPEPAPKPVPEPAPVPRAAPAPVFAERAEPEPVDAQALALAEQLLAEAIQLEADEEEAAMRAAELLLLADD